MATGRAWWSGGAAAHVRHQSQAGARVDPPVSDRHLSEQRYDHWVRAVQKYHEGPEPLPRSGPKGHNLALRLRDYKTDTVRFLRASCVPFTNNQAEQTPRMIKLRTKISGGFRSERRAKDFATLCNVLSTARKRGFNWI